MSAMDKQVGGTHYKDMPVQPLQLMRDVMGDAHYCYFLLGNIIKYRMRAGKKTGTDDAAKAEHYSELLQEVLDAKPHDFGELNAVKTDWAYTEARLLHMGF